MPTKKQIVQVVMEDETYEKFLTIAEQQGRSKSNLAQFIIKEYVDSHISSKKTINAYNGGIELVAEEIPEARKTVIDKTKPIQVFTAIKE